MSQNLLPDWEAQGFAAEPERHLSTGGEILVRAFNPDAMKNREASKLYATGSGTLSDTQRAELGKLKGHGTSGILSNCFFVPSYGTSTGAILPRAINMDNWDGPFLEDHLSAFIFGNDYAALVQYRMPPGILYRIGRIARYPRHVQTYDGRSHIEHWRPTNPKPDSTMFRQVVLVPGSRAQLDLLLNIGEKRIMGLGKLSATRH